MINRFLKLFLFIGVAVTACDSDDEPSGPMETRLDYYIESFEIAGFEVEPQYMVRYEYTSFGQLEKYIFYGYDPDKEDLFEQRSFIFSYKDGKVDKMEGFLANSTTPYLKYKYHYNPDSRVAKIEEENSGTGINSEAVFSYIGNNEVKVSYQYSNGGGFAYTFDYSDGNILTDKTTRGAQLCSDGIYTYDQQKNPFKTLGYVDYLLLNFSTNNKLTENVNYVGCAFPTVIPESYDYEYNSDGYPTKGITTYKSGGAVNKSMKKFYYTRVRTKGL